MVPIPESPDKVSVGVRSPWVLIFYLEIKRRAVNLYREFDGHLVKNVVDVLCGDGSYE